MLFNLIMLAGLNLFSSPSPPHDIAMAVFAITLAENSAHVKVQLDKGDIDELLKTATMKLIPITT